MSSCKRCTPVGADSLPATCGTKAIHGHAQAVSWVPINVGAYLPRFPVWNPNCDRVVQPDDLHSNLYEFFVAYKYGTACMLQNDRLRQPDIEQTKLHAQECICGATSTTGEAKEALLELSQDQERLAVSRGGSTRTDRALNCSPSLKSATGVLQTTISPVVPLSCLLYTSPSPRDRTRSRMPSSA